MFNDFIILIGTLIMLLNCIEFIKFRSKLNLTLNETGSKFKIITLSYQILIWAFLAGYFFTFLLVKIHKPDGKLIFLVGSILFWGSVFVFINLRFLKFMLKNILHARLAETDTMTGLYNKVSGHKHIENAIDEETDPIYIAILDLDNFKQINDIYGHLAGDEVIKETAQIILDVKDKDDIACRFGGDEFIICLKNKSKDEIENIFIELSKQICMISGKYSNSNLSCSIGATLCIGKTAGGTASYEETITKADKALYYIKNNGKCGYHIF